MRQSYSSVASEGEMHRNIVLLFISVVFYTIINYSNSLWQNINKYGDFYLVESQRIQSVFYIGHFLCFKPNNSITDGLLLDVCIIEVDKLNSSLPTFIKYVFLESESKRFSTR